MQSYLYLLIPVILCITIARSPSDLKEYKKLMEEVAIPHVQVGMPRSHPFLLHTSRSVWKVSHMKVPACVSQEGRSVFTAWRRAFDWTIH